MYRYSDANVELGHDAIYIHLYGKCDAIHLQPCRRPKARTINPLDSHCRGSYPVTRGIEASKEA